MQKIIDKFCVLFAHQNHFWLCAVGEMVRWHLKLICLLIEKYSVSDADSSCCEFVLRNFLMLYSGICIDKTIFSSIVSLSS